jgi:hypothetical protein
MTHTIAAAPERAQIDVLDFTITGAVKVDTARVQISRRLWMDRDIDGSWAILCETKAGADITGVIRAEAPPVAAFLDDLAAMIAEPEAFKG